MKLVTVKAGETGSVERWGVVDIAVECKFEGNPFKSCELRAVFQGDRESKEVYGFYDGGEIFKVRFNPEYEGCYSYTLSGYPLDGEVRGTFSVTPATGDNHGPLRVVNKYHFAFADGTPFYVMGTTGYGWLPEPDDVFEITMDELKKGYFNKARIDLAPRNVNTDGLFIYKRFKNDDGTFRADFDYFDPEFFQVYEKQVAAMDDINFMVDMIILNPYEQWGHSKLEGEQMDMYWKYLALRFSAFKNVWYSMANEYDLIFNLDDSDWEHFASILTRYDKFGRLKSIHNWGPIYVTQGHEYDYSRPWVTHVCLQRQELYKNYEFEDIPFLREKYGKPVLFDEVGYEGNILQCFGNITGEEMVRRFWDGIVRGGYVTHGDCMTEPGKMFPAERMGNGGRFKGESAPRIKFLNEVLASVPGYGLRQLREEVPTTFTLRGDERFIWDDVIAVPEDPQYKEQYFLAYFSHFRPLMRHYHFDDVTDYHVELIDTWNMTIEDLGVRRGDMVLDMPGRPYMAIRFTKV